MRAVPSEGVGHVKVNASRGSPWSGVSPLAHLSATALASLERSLGYETTPPSGLLMAMPDGVYHKTQVEAAADRHIDGQRRYQPHGNYGGRIWTR